MAGGKAGRLVAPSDDNVQGERRRLLHATSSSSLLSVPSESVSRQRPISYGAASIEQDGLDDPASPSGLSSGLSVRRKKTWREKLEDKREVLKVLPVIVLWAIGRYAPIAAAADSTRSYSCGAFYEKHPELVDAPGMDHVHPCAANVIESSTADLLLATSLVEVLGAALSILLFSPKLGKWGRKPVILIALLPSILINAPYLFLPHSYPYGPAADKVSIPPSISRWIVLAFTFLGGVAGSDNLILCAMRCTLIDLSTPASRSKLLILLMICVMAGIALGPLIAGVASTYFPIDAQHLVHDLASVMAWRKHPASSPSNPMPRPPSSNPDLPIPGMPLPPHRHPHAPRTPSKPVGSAHNNVTPFIVSIAFTFVAIVVCWSITPETLREKAPGPESEEGEDEDNKTKPKKSDLMSTLSLLLPIRVNNGGRDWRLSRVLLSQICILLGAAALNTLVTFVGGPLDWSPSMVGYLLSWVATSRSIALIVFAPLAIALLEKLRSLRPPSLVDFSVESLKSIAKTAKPDQVPGGESTFVDPREHGRRALAPIVTLWRANIDVTFAKFSFAAEVFGWLVISAGATFFSGSAVPIFLGTSLLACGGGGMPSLQGAGVTIATDVLASAASPSKRSLNPTDVYMSISSLLESIVVFVALIGYTALYDLALGTLPALPFLAAGSAYALGSICISTINVHRTSHSPA